MFKPKENSISSTSWVQEGFTIADLFSETEFQEIKRQTTQVVIASMKQAGVEEDLSSFRLEEYHQHVKNDDLHRTITTMTRELKFKDLNLDTRAITQRVGQILDRKVSHINPELVEEIIIVRISRPQSLDINPPHRDGYLDIWKNTVNLWIPISGCTNKTSLPLIPGSHLWKENQVLRTENGGAKINGRDYRVPGIVNSREGLKMVRPNPQYGQALVFTPFLIHGAAINQSQNETRVSFELRLSVS